jgi:hypothetical protein
VKTISIGRAPDNDLVLTDEKVSRYHARVYKRSERWYIVDLQSTHGTMVNNMWVESPVKLKPSAAIKMGATKLSFDGFAFYSQQGKMLLSLADAVPAPGSSELSGGTGSASSSAAAVSAGRTNLIVMAAIASVLLIAGAILLVNRDVAPEQPPVVAETPAPPPVVVQHGTIEHNGGTYTGDLVNGLPHGFGTIVFPPRQGTLSFHDSLISTKERGQKYEGHWQNGYMHGAGKMTLTDGSLVEGYWENGNFTGRSQN